MLILMLLALTSTPKVPYYEGVTLNTCEEYLGSYEEIQDVRIVFSGCKQGEFTITKRFFYTKVDMFLLKHCETGDRLSTREERTDLHRDRDFVQAACP